MKKQFFTLVMMLAIVVLAGSSAKAQVYGSTAAENTNTDRYVMLAGSSYNLTIGTDANASSTEWTLHNESDNSVVGASVASVSGETGSVYTINWTQNSVGTYYAQVVQTRNSCTTTRRFYITIIDFDILVYAANEDGSFADQAAELAYCGDGTTLNYGDMSSGAAFSNAYNSQPANTNSGDLVGNIGTDPRTTRYIGIQVIWNLGGTGITAPTVGSMNFSYAVSVDDANLTSSYTQNADLYSVNGTTTSALTGTSTIELKADGAANVWTATDFGANTAKGPSAVLEIVVNDRWSSSTVTDLTVDFSISNAELRVAADGSGLVMGVEPDGYVNSTVDVVAVTTASNKAHTQTIQLAPATSTITVGQN